MTQSIPDQPVPHGTTNGYSHYKCRCDPCKRASSEYQSAYYRRNIERTKARVKAAHEADPGRRRRNMAAYLARKRVANPGFSAEQKMYRKEYYEKNRERSAADTKAYREANPGRGLESGRRYREAHPDRARAACQRWAAKNPHKIVAQSALRRARRRANDTRTVTDRDWLRLCARYGNRCAYCDKADKLTQDHVIPVVRGGRHAIGNLLPACKSCNSRKRHRLLMEWRIARLAAAA